MADLMDCPQCNNVPACTMWYGMAPHAHTIEEASNGAALLTTQVEPREKWPDNFTEDPECPGLGVWTCGLCDGDGRVEEPIGAEWLHRSNGGEDVSNASNPPSGDENG